jgi:hypothetical protein
MVLSGITPMIKLQLFKPLLFTSVINGGACSVKATLVTKQLILSRKRYTPRVQQQRCFIARTLEHRHV